MKQIDPKGATMHLRAGLLRILAPRGFHPLGRGLAFAAPRPGSDTESTLLCAVRHPKWVHPGVAASVTIEIGLGSASEPEDLRSSALRALPFVLGDGALIRDMCRVHNVVVGSFTQHGDDGVRAAMLLGTVETDAWRGAPETLWFGTAEHLDIWLEYLGRAVPVALERLSRSSLARARVQALLVLAAAVEVEPGGATRKEK